MKAFTMLRSETSKILTHLVSLNQTMLAKRRINWKVLEILGIYPSPTTFAQDRISTLSMTNNCTELFGEDTFFSTNLPSSAWSPSFDSLRASALGI